MNTKLISILCAGFVFLAGCQPATPEPVPQAVEPTLSIATSSPTTAPSSTPTTVPPTGTAASSPTPTAQEPVHITAFCTIIGKDVQTYVKPGTPVTLTWGWSATSEKLIDDFLHDHLTEITFDGKVIEGERVEGIQKNQTSGEPEVVWYADLGVLEPGVHIVTYDLKFKQRIEDGHATYGPGGKYESFHDQCEIIVE
jgi:hypothetical protein